MTTVVSTQTALQTETSVASLPAYSLQDEGFGARIAAAQASPHPPPLPLTQPPPLPPRRHQHPGTTDAEHAAAVESYELQLAILGAFFDSIASGRDDLLASLVSAGLVSPDCPSPHGETPLLAAVRAGRPATVRTLLALGADVDGLGRPQGPRRDRLRPPRRTPLQLAAARGDLVMVRLLVRSCGADDAAVSPDDGAIALRLAADAGHRHVVAYLPARRAGALLRWRAARAREAEVVRAAAWNVALFVYVLAWELPCLLLLWAPRSLWRRRRDIGLWCVRQARDVPRHIERSVRGVAEAARGAPELARWTGAALQRLAVGIPGAVAVAACWAGEGLRGLLGALLGVAERAVSVLHTAVMWAVCFFGAVTLADVRNGLVALGQAVVADLPQALWYFGARFGKMTWDFLAALLGNLGGLLWYLGYAVTWLVRFIPAEVGKILMAAARLVQHGLREFRICLDPKTV